jgi:hypothetical protein
MEDLGYATHILNNTHSYGTNEEIMEKIDHARKGLTVNIKENFYIYIYKHYNKLIENKEPR